MGSAKRGAEAAGTKVEKLVNNNKEKMPRVRQNGIDEPANSAVSARWMTLPHAEPCPRWPLCVCVGGAALPPCRAVMRVLASIGKRYTPGEKNTLREVNVSLSNFWCLSPECRGCMFFFFFSFRVYFIVLCCVTVIAGQLA